MKQIRNQASIEVEDHQTLSDIQQAFCSTYPHLKLLFHCRKNERDDEASARIIKHSGLQFGACRTVRELKTFLITSEMSVSEVERQFAAVYGLEAQVFRRSGNVWIQPRLTGEWTLAEQNRQGEILCTYLAGPRRRRGT